MVELDSLPALALLCVTELAVDAELAVDRRFLGDGVTSASVATDPDEGRRGLEA